jgi:hypothetical protein
MGEKDLAIAVAMSPSVGGISKKPAYLIELNPDNSKSKNATKFISLDKPELLEGFIAVKGIYSEATVEEIVKSYQDLLLSAPKELVLETMFPWHKISSIRSLVFRAK